LLLRRISAAKLFIGGTGTGCADLHYDGFHTHAFSNQIYGRKEFVLYTPQQTPYLYPKAKTPNVSMMSVLNRVDNEFPLFLKATPTECVLEAGDTIFIPSGWWHTTRILSPSISVSLNVANHSNWRYFVQDTKNSPYWTRSKGLLLCIYLSAYGVLKSLAPSAESGTTREKRDAAWSFEP
jgi:hypothetical protein